MANSLQRSGQTESPRKVLHFYLELDRGDWYQPYKMEFDVTNFDDFKQEFLKRFGNVNTASNMTIQEKNKLKQQIYQTRNFVEFDRIFHKARYWNLKYRYH